MRESKFIFNITGKFIDNNFISQNVIELKGDRREILSFLMFVLNQTTEQINKIVGYKESCENVCSENKKLN